MLHSFNTVVQLIICFGLVHTLSMLGSTVIVIVRRRLAIAHIWRFLAGVLAKENENIIHR